MIPGLLIFCAVFDEKRNECKSFMYQTIMLILKRFLFRYIIAIQFLPGTVPAPLIFGAIFDASCSLWQDTCGERGSCYFYDKQQLALGMFCVCIGYKGCALVFMILAWVFYKPPKTEVIDEIDVNNDDVKDNETKVKDGDVIIKSPSTAELNKAFDKDYNDIKSKGQNATNGYIHSDTMINGEKPKDLTDRRVNDFFLASSAKNSPVMTGRLMTTAL